jgi:hypothetical protein
MKMFALILSLAVGAVCSPCFAQTTEDKRAIQLENERKKLDKTKDPADRAESLMKIAGIKLEYMVDAARMSDFASMQSSLQQYRQAVTDARDTMMNSGLNPYKKPKGYQAVEVAVRKHVAVLQDTARSLTLSQREPIEETIQTVSKIRNEFLHALFKQP